MLNLYVYAWPFMQCLYFISICPEKSFNSGNHPLQECLPYRVSASQGCPPFSGVHLTRVSILQECLPSRDVIAAGVFFFQGHPLYRGLPPYIWLFFLERSALNLSQLENKNVTAVYSHNYLW